MGEQTFGKIIDQLLRLDSRDEALARVQQALDTLTPEKRAVFVLYELEGQSCDAVAKALGIPVGTVYSRLHSARREFTKAHAKLEEEDPKTTSADVDEPVTAGA